MQPLLKFKAYCDPKHRDTSPYFWVTIWRTLPQARQHMFDLCSAFGFLQPERDRCADSLGACFSWETESFRYKPNGELLPEMGAIVLAMAYTGSGVISHECTHAASSYSRRRTRLKLEDLPDIDEEERLCLTVGYLTRQVVKRLCAYDARKKRPASV